MILSGDALLFDLRAAGCCAVRSCRLISVLVYRRQLVLVKLGKLAALLGDHRDLSVRASARVHEPPTRAALLVLCLGLLEQKWFRWSPRRRLNRPEARSREAKLILVVPDLVCCRHWQCCVVLTLHDLVVRDWSQ